MSAGTVIESLRENFSGCTIIGTDIYSSKQVITSKKVDYFYNVPKAYSSHYCEAITDISHRHGVDFILPLTDPEVDVLSDQRIKHEFLKDRLALSNNKTIVNCRDKEKVARFFSECKNVQVIDSFTPNEMHLVKLQYPLLAKPKKGRSSEGVQYIYSNKELASLDDSYIVQPLLDGVIVTVDFVRDHSGNVACLPRKELSRTPRGAGVDVQIFQDPKICELISTIANKLNIIGCMNLEFIHANGHYYLMDINPRFSAGVGFSKQAGYDFVFNHIRVYCGQHILDMGDINLTAHSTEIRSAVFY